MTNIVKNIVFIFFIISSAIFGACVIYNGLIWLSYIEVFNSILRVYGEIIRLNDFFYLSIAFGGFLSIFIGFFSLVLFAVSRKSYPDLEINLIYIILPISYGLIQFIYFFIFRDPV